MTSKSARENAKLPVLLFFGCFFGLWRSGFSRCGKCSIRIGSSGSSLFFAFRFTARGKPCFGFCFLRRFGGSFGIGFAFGAQFFDQLVFFRAVIAAFFGRSLCFNAGTLRRLGENRVKLALRTQTKGYRILWLDILDVPVRALFDRADCVARRADEFRDLRIGNFGVVAQDPGDAVRLILTL